MEVVWFFRTVTILDDLVSLEGHNFSALWIEMRS